MVEQNSDNGVIVIGKVLLHETHRGSVLESIPSDDENNISMNIQWGFGDAFVSMSSKDPQEFIYLPTMRFRTHAGGSNLPMIANELSVLPKSFIDTKGTILEKPIRFPERIKSFDPIKFIKGTLDDDFALRIKNITEDDEIIGKWTKFMDIDLLKSKDIRITMRNIEYETNGTMIFKTKGNNGQFPVMAEVFRRIGDELQKSKK